jgi:hypothetical protein
MNSPHTVHLSLLYLVLCTCVNFKNSQNQILWSYNVQYERKIPLFHFGKYHTSLRGKDWVCGHVCAASIWFKCHFLPHISKSKQMLLLPTETIFNTHLKIFKILYWSRDYSIWKWSVIWQNLAALSRPVRSRNPLTTLTVFSVRNLQSPNSALYSKQLSTGSITRLISLHISYVVICLACWISVGAFSCNNTAELALKGTASCYFECPVIAS